MYKRQAIITGIILFRMNAMLFSISLFMALVSILLVLVFKQPYKRINEEDVYKRQAQCSAAHRQWHGARNRGYTRPDSRR